MSFIYLSQGFTIYPHRHTIEHQGNSQVVRPKTFALLLLLLQHPQQILGKRFLLETVWDDVTVEEQVLVQSIRELRQLFNSAEIIQTYPRKGYAWSAQVQCQPLDCNSLHNTVAEALPPPPPPQPVHSKPPVRLRRHGILLTAVACGVAATVAMYNTRFDGGWAPVYSGFNKVFATINQPHKNTPTAVVIVLPVRNQVEGNDHHWVALGAMDQLIKALISDQRVQVMDAEYVLGVMRNAQIPRLYGTEHIPQIFIKSGATLVVESQLSGTVEDYRLDYTLHSHTNSQRGVVFAKSINLALQQLTQTLATHTGQSFNALATNGQQIFNNELLARAVEKLDAGELPLAQSLLTSLKQLEPANVTVREILAQALIQAQAYDAATAEITAAITSSGPVSSKLHYLLASTQFQQQQFGAALASLTQAQSLAESRQDILYQAYIAQLRGVIQQKLGHYDQAEAAYRQALTLHGVIRCPIGMSISHLQLAEVLRQQGNTDAASTHHTAAKALIQQHQLTNLSANLSANLEASNLIRQ